jgi:hypothetical protein
VWPVEKAVDVHLVKCVDPVIQDRGVSFIYDALEAVTLDYQYWLGSLVWSGQQCGNTRHVMPIEVGRPPCELEPRRHLFGARGLTYYLRAFVLRLFEHGKVLQYSRSKSIEAWLRPLQRQIFFRLRHENYHEASMLPCSKETLAMYRLPCIGLSLCECFLGCFCSGSASGPNHPLVMNVSPMLFQCS